MAIDYAAALETANRLVQENGRQMTFNRLASTPADPAKPWNGPANPRSPVAETQTLYAVEVDPASLGKATQDLDFVKRSTKFLIVAPGAYLGDLALFHEVLDEASLWRVQGAERLRPAGTTLLWYVGVRQ